MPKLKPTESEQFDRSTRAVIASAQIEKDIKDKEITKALGKTERTWRNKKDNPGTFTLAEIRTLIKTLRLDSQEILKLVGGNR